MDITNLDMTGYVGNPTSIWTPDNCFDFMSQADIVQKAEALGENIMKDFYWLLNNDYLEQNGRKHEYKPNEKWITAYAFDVCSDEDSNGWN